MISLPAILRALCAADVDLWFAKKQTKMIGTASGRRSTDGTLFSVNEFYIFCNPSIARLAIKERRQRALRAVRHAILACALLQAACRHGGAA